MIDDDNNGIMGFDNLIHVWVTCPKFWYVVLFRL